MALAVFGPAVEDRLAVLGLGVLTTLLIVPWLVLSALGAAHRQEPASTARATRVRRG